MLLVNKICRCSVQMWIYRAESEIKVLTRFLHMNCRSVQKEQRTTFKNRNHQIINRSYHVLAALKQTSSFWVDRSSAIFHGFHISAHNQVAINMMKSFCKTKSVIRETGTTACSALARFRKHSESLGESWESFRESILWKWLNSDIRPSVDNNVAGFHSLFLFLFTVLLPQAKFDSDGVVDVRTSSRLCCWHLSGG